MLTVNRDVGLARRDLYALKTLKATLLLLVTAGSQDISPQYRVASYPFALRDFAFGLALVRLFVANAFADNPDESSTDSHLREASLRDRSYSNFSF